ncbi:MAG: hypothetical protein F4Z55_14495 [Boseongicola sp. SB0667_bin_21]|nr:hypothetical protein [Boseongicola sp. SB0667_bin_21]
MKVRSPGLARFEVVPVGEEAGRPGSALMPVSACPHPVRAATVRSKAHDGDGPDEGRTGTPVWTSEQSAFRAGQPHVAAPDLQTWLMGHPFLSCWLASGCRRIDRTASEPVLGGMSGDPDIHGLDRKLAFLEERMSTKQAGYRGDLADLMREIATSNAETQKQIANTNAETRKRLATVTERMATTRWWQTAVLPGGMGIVAAVIIAAVA